MSASGRRVRIGPRPARFRAALSRREDAPPREPRRGAPVRRAHFLRPTMATASAGDTVHIHYTGTLADGTEFDSSRGREPLSFTLGAGQVVPGFDRAVDGMETGETKTVTIPAAEAYGERDPENMLVVPVAQLPAGVSVGDQLALTTPDGQQVPVTVAAIDADGAMIDANHALAGQDLTFEITLVRADA